MADGIEGRTGRRGRRRLEDLEALGAAGLLVGVAAALAAANSPLAPLYARLLHAPVLPGVLDGALADGRRIVDDVLMTAFFLVVGEELGREGAGAATGGMAGARDRRGAFALALGGAAGGMAGAALVYRLATLGVPGRDAWAIPMATDVAFVLGALAVAGRRAVPRGLRSFLLALAVADDVGSVLVVAVVAHRAFDAAALAGAGVLFVGLYVGRTRLRGAVLLAVLPVAWCLLALAGVEPALAGAAVGVVAGSGARRPRWLCGAPVVSSFVALPLLALADGGAHLSARLFDVATPPGRVFLAVALARVVGKAAGVLGGATVVRRMERLPPSVPAGRLELAGGAAVAGIGFTVPLLVASLVFASEPALEQGAVAGLYVGSTVAFALGVAVLRLGARRRGARRQEAAVVPGPRPPGGGSRGASGT